MLELSDLKREIRSAGAEPKDVLRSEPETGGVSDTRHGEPATILAAMLVSQIVLTGLAIYLAKKREKNTLEVEIFYENAQGEKVAQRIRSTASTEEAITADFLKQLKAITVPTAMRDSGSSLRKTLSAAGLTRLQMPPCSPGSTRCNT